MTPNKCGWCSKATDFNVVFCNELCRQAYSDTEAMRKATLVESKQEEESEQIKNNYSFIEIEAQKINLQKGDTLMVTVKNSYIENVHIQKMAEQFHKVFPNNKVFIFSVEIDGDIKFATVSQPEIKVEPPVNLGYYNDCNCGKKEAAEGKKNE